MFKTLTFYRSISRNVYSESRIPNEIERSYYDPLGQREQIRI